MVAPEFLDQHSLAHAAMPADSAPWWAGGRRIFAQSAEMFDDAARASKANPPFRADGANAQVIWRIEKADDPGRDMQWTVIGPKTPYRRQRWSVWPHRSL